MAGANFPPRSVVLRFPYYQAAHLKLITVIITSFLPGHMALVMRLTQADHCDAWYSAGQARLSLGYGLG